MKLNILPLMSLAALLSGCATSICSSEGSKTLAGEAFASYVQTGELPGAISVFYKDGKEEICCAGYADVSTKRPITIDDAFMQCSQTKGFCGVTIAKLVEEGKISLDDPVSKYLPEFETLWVQTSETNGVRTLKKAKNVLTVRMCLNHTGGFPFETSVKMRMLRGGGWTGGAPIRQTAACAAASPLSFEPGTDMRYSNTGIDIGAAVVEVVTGQRWEDYLQQVVLDPLGMTETTFWPTEEQLAHHIFSYTCKSNAPAAYLYEHGWSQRPYNDRSRIFASAGAGLWTTTRDQLKFYKMLMNLGVGENGVRILKEETVKSILAKSTRPLGKTVSGNAFGSYSLGLTAPLAENDNENAWFGHGGAWGTQCSVNWHKKHLKMIVVQLEGQPRPWLKGWNDAAERFFASKADDNGVKAYTGRTE